MYEGYIPDKIIQITVSILPSLDLFQLSDSFRCTFSSSDFKLNILTYWFVQVKQWLPLFTSNTMLHLVTTYWTLCIRRAGLFTSYESSAPAQHICL